MGYETTLIFVYTWGRKKKGFWEVVASINLGKVAWGEFGRLIDELSTKNRKWLEKRKRIAKWLDEWETIKSKLLYEVENLEKEEIEELKTRRFELERILEKHLPMIFFKNDNYPSFTDDYGDLLMVTDLETVKDAIIKTQAEELVKDGAETTYRRFDVALAMIDAFILTKEKWNNNIKVILWGC